MLDQAIVVEKGEDKVVYYIDKSVLVENRPLLKFIRNYIRDSSGVFSIFSYSCLYSKKKITR